MRLSGLSGKVGLKYERGIVYISHKGHQNRASANTCVAIFLGVRL